MPRAPIRVFTSMDRAYAAQIKFPVILYFDRTTTDNRRIRGPRRGGAFGVRMPAPIIFNGDHVGVLTTVVVHDSHVEAIGWLHHLLGPVWPAVDLDATAPLRFHRGLCTFTASELRAVTLHSVEGSARVWPDMPDAEINETY